MQRSRKRILFQTFDVFVHNVTMCHILSESFNKINRLFETAWVARTTYGLNALTLFISSPHITKHSSC